LSSFLQKKKPQKQSQPTRQLTRALCVSVSIIRTEYILLYKYLDFDRVDILERLGIRFSPLKSLNDPFENLCLIDLSSEASEQELQIITGLEDLWDENKSEHTEENRKLFEIKKVEMLKQLRQTFCPSNLGQEFMSIYGANLGVLSLSRTEKSLLMWSHYASEGKGFVIAFDDKHSFFHQPDQKGNATKPIPVKYSSKRQKLKPGIEDVYQKFLCEKPLEWAYEEEERIFRKFLTKEGSVGKDQYGQDIILSCLPSDSIKEIYIGYRATQETKSRIYFALHKNGISCSVFNSEICNDSYNIIFSKVLDT
jgi:hypothetical protein